MPIFRGVEITVVASTEAKKLREYPHPDGSSVRLVSVEDIRDGNLLTTKPSDSSILSDGDPTRQKKVNPRTSVYIPSMPGIPSQSFNCVVCHSRLTNPRGAILGQIQYHPFTSSCHSSLFQDVHEWPSHYILGHPFG
jgi:hypothetical protein